MEMEENERIPEPQRSYNFIIFLDGNIAGYKSDELNYKTGKRKFTFKPTDDMRYFEKIQDFEFNQETGLIEKEYDDNLCINRSRSARSIKWFLFCDWKGNPINVFEKMNIKLLTQNRAFRRELDTTRMALLIAQKESMNRESHREESDANVYKRLKSFKGIIGEDSGNNQGEGNS